MKQSNAVLTTPVVRLVRLLMIGVLMTTIMVLLSSCGGAPQAGKRRITN